MTVEDPLRSVVEPTRLRAIRRSRGITAAEFARLTGYTKQTVGQFELGNVKPWPKFRRIAAEVLGIDEATLFGDVL